MKLLYIGHYKENSGWSKAAINAVEAISTTDIDVVCRNVKLTDNDTQCPNTIAQLEDKDLNNIDYCIQHVLPHHLTGTQKFKKNIAYFVYEFDSVKHHNWCNSLRLMDEIWVPNADIKTGLIKDGFDNKIIRIIPHAFDISQYKDVGQRIFFQNKNHTFKFYFVCDIDDRKNIESIIKCFHSEFHSSEPVSLVLKIKKSGINPSVLRQGIERLCSEVKSNMRLYKDINDYHQEIIITENLTDEQMKVLHLSCDCYVGPTHGEGWGIPAFDAMCYGNTPICSNEGGAKEFIDPNNKNTGWLVNGIYNICQHRNAAFPDIFTGYHHWFIPDELEIKKAMRFYYDNKNQKSQDGKKRAEMFSYGSVGSMIKDALNG